MEAAMRGMYGRHATPGTPRTPARIDTRKVRGTREELFQAVDDEGTRWIFAVLRDAGREGECGRQRRRIPRDGLNGGDRSAA